MLYDVRSPGGRVARVEAANSTQAKRLACRRWGYRPSDYWVGITSMKATRVKS